MRNLRYLVKRNLELFWNNRLNILLSAASIPIVLCLYGCFLREFLTGMAGQVGIPAADVKEFTDRIMFAGLLIVINTTTCFGIIQICVNDSAVGIRRDFLVAPITPFSVLLGYWISATLISGLFTFATALLGEVFFKTLYGRTLSGAAMLSVAGILLFSSFINAGILLCLAKNIKNTTTFSTFANLYGTVIGFLSGAYLPYYFYPKWLKPLLLWFLPTQTTSLLRQQYDKVLAPRLAESVNGQAITTIRQSFGIELTRNNISLFINQQWSILVFGLAVILFYLWISSSKNN